LNLSRGSTRPYQLNDTNLLTPNYITVGKCIQYLYLPLESDVRKVHILLIKCDVYAIDTAFMYMIECNVYSIDTAFMYMIGWLSMIKIYQSRHPDVNAHAHTAYCIIAFFVFVGVIGVVSIFPLYY